MISHAKGFLELEEELEFLRREQEGKLFNMAEFSKDSRDKEAAKEIDLKFLQ